MNNRKHWWLCRVIRKHGDDKRLRKEWFVFNTDCRDFTFGDVLMFHEVYKEYDLVHQYYYGMMYEAEFEDSLKTHNEVCIWERNKCGMI